MKKLFLLIGLVVFLTPMVVSSNEYYCKNTKSGEYKIYDNGCPSGHFNMTKHDYDTYLKSQPQQVKAEYIGDLKNGQAHGFGIYKYSNGDTYEGEWQNGKRHGYGIYLIKKNNITKKFGISNRFFSYEGEWRNGKFHGRGIAKYYVNCKKGCYQGSNYIDKHIGQFVNGLLNGEGTRFLSDGRFYTGIWNKGKLGKVIIKAEKIKWTPSDEAIKYGCHKKSDYKKTKKCIKAKKNFIAAKIAQQNKNSQGSSQSGQQAQNKNEKSFDQKWGKTEKTYSSGYEKWNDKWGWTQY